MTLKLRDVVVRKGAFRLAADFEVAASGVTVVFGPSGSGKSSLLSAIAGLNRLESGSLSLSGRGRHGLLGCGGHACVLWFWLCGQLVSGALTTSPSCWPPAGYGRSSSPLGRRRCGGCLREVLLSLWFLEPPSEGS